MTKQKVLIIGYGQMALAIIKGILHSGLDQKYSFEICGRDTQKAKDFLQTHQLQEFFSVIETDNAVNINERIVFLCIKPQGLGSFTFRGDALKVVSVMAGVKIEQIKKSISARDYIRIMPNTAAKYQKSSSAVFCENNSLLEIQDLLESFGSIVLVDQEKLIDSSIATSGSAPAFVALVAQSLIDAGVREGLNRNQSKELVRGMFEGFASLIKESEPQEIIDAITSPGGTTIEGLSILEERGVRGAFIQACHQAVAKSKMN